MLDVGPEGALLPLGTLSPAVIGVRGLDPVASLLGGEVATQVVDAREPAA